VPLPELGEQREIVTVLDALDKKIALHQEKLLRLAELFRSLLHKLMTEEISADDLVVPAGDAAAAVSAA
jgi:type I restriction enzyme S subunit